MYSYTATIITNSKEKQDFTIIAESFYDAYSYLIDDLDSGDRIAYIEEEKTIVVPRAGIQ